MGSVKIYTAIVSYSVKISLFKLIHGHGNKAQVNNNFISFTSELEFACAVPYMYP